MKLYAKITSIFVAIIATFTLLTVSGSAQDLKIKASASDKLKAIA